MKEEREAESMSPYLPDSGGERSILNRPSDNNPLGGLSPRVPENKEGTVNFDLSEGPGLRCDLPEANVPSYLASLTNPFAARCGSPTPPLSGQSTPMDISGQNPLFQPLTQSILAAQRYAMSRQILNSAAESSLPNPVPAPEKAPEDYKKAEQACSNPSASGADPTCITNTTTATAPTGKGRRGRKKKRITAEVMAVETQKKMEKNRLFARENRRRKKMYINSLENQITCLKAELDVCKKKLAEYENMEKARYMNCMDFYMHVQADSRHLQQQLLSQIISYSQSSQLGIRNITPLLKSILEDRRKALDVMAETFVQFSLPASHRYMMYMAEHDTDALPRVAGGPQTKEIVEQLKVDELALMKIKENKSFFKEAALELRKTFNKFFAYHRRMQDQVSKIDVFMIEHLIPKLTPGTVTNYMKWVRLMASQQDPPDVSFFKEPELIGGDLSKRHVRRLMIKGSTEETATDPGNKVKEEKKEGEEKCLDSSRTVEGDSKDPVRIDQC